MEPEQKKQPAKPAPAPKPEDENLFDEASRRLPRAALLATLSQRAARERAADAAEEVVLVGHEEEEEEVVAVKPAARPAPVRPRASANPLRAAATGGITNPLR